MKKLLLTTFFISILFINVELYSVEKKYIFKDQTISDETTGITIMTNKSKDVVIVTNTILHYAIIFPYSNKWEFKIDDRYAIIGNSGKINISLQMYENNKKKTGDYLSDLMKIFEDNKAKNGVIEAKILEHNKNLILRTVVDPAIIYKNDDTFQNVKQINYFSTKTFDNVRYHYHSSVVVETSEEINEKDFLNFATEGFFVDFGRK